MAWIAKIDAEADYLDGIESRMVVRSADDMETIAYCFDEKHTHLIAAAPDMLDALRQWKAAETMKDFDELRNAKASRDAAIAKATGG